MKSGFSFFARLTVLLGLMLALFLNGAGCSIDLIYGETSTPPASFVPNFNVLFEINENDYEIVTKTTYYPESASEEDAAYVLTVSAPVFNEDVLYAADMNAHMNIFNSELMKRVEEERLPIADRPEGSDAPYTVVECSISCARGFVNVLFEESYSFGVEEIVQKKAVVLKAGEVVGLATASGAYDAKMRTAQQIFNIVAAQEQSMYYPDLTLNDIANEIDMFNGFYVTDRGFDVFFSSGVLASNEFGEQVFPVEAASLYPDAVGDSISVGDYEKTLDALNRFVTAAGSGYETVLSGFPDSSLATAFMILLITDLSVEMDLETDGNGVIHIDENVFKTLYSDYFYGAFPGIASVTCGKAEETENGYTVYSNGAKPYRFVLGDASEQGGKLILLGEIMYGEPDDTTATSMAGVEITLRRDNSATMGFRFESISLT